MKKFLSIVGGIFLVIVVIGAGLIGYAAYQGRGLDASSKTYVEANVPPIISTWSKDELLKRSSPQLLKAVNDNPGHPVGDVVLAEAARRMKAALRGYDRFSEVRAVLARQIL